MNEDKVYIPETIEESDEDSESLSEKLRKIGALGNNGQGCSSNTSHQVWLFGNSQLDTFETCKQSLLKKWDLEPWKLKGRRLWGKQIW